MDMDAPGFNLLELRRKRKSTWSVRVNKNWRTTFHLTNSTSRTWAWMIIIEIQEIKMHIPPHPGDILREGWIEPLGLTITTAQALGATHKSLSAILNGRSGISPVMTLRLSRATDRTLESWPRRVRR